MCDDDEDCIDGSGSGERHSHVTSTSNNVHPVYGQSGHHYHQTTKSPWQTWTPPTTSQPIEEPPPNRHYPIFTTSKYDPIQHFTSPPVTSPPVYSKPTIHSYQVRGTPPPHKLPVSTGPPKILNVSLAQKDFKS
jgi:hypothetical protein